MTKLKVLLVVRNPVGGIRNFMQYSYRRFPVDKYEFVMVAPDLPETKILMQSIGGDHFRHVAVDRRLGLRQLALLIYELLRAERFDLVHSQGMTSGLSALAGARLTGTRHLLTLHDVFTQGQFVGIGGIFKKIGLDLALCLVDRIHCVGHDARQNLLGYLPLLRLIRGKFVNVVLNGIDTERVVKAHRRDLRSEFNLPATAFLIGFLGRFMNQKGFKELVEALQILQSDNKLTRQPLVLCFSQEDGFIREERAAVKTLGLEKSILFLPFVPEVGATLKGLDVVAMPSRWEACPLLPMEVMVAGVPLVGSDCIGLKEVIANSPAKMFPARDSKALAKALREEMIDPSTAEARAFADEAQRRFDVGGRAIELEALVSDCIGTGRQAV